MDHTQAVRKTIVTSISVSHRKAGDPMYPIFGCEELDGKDVWVVLLNTRTGLLPEEIKVRYFTSQAAADAFLALHVEGTEIDAKIHWLGSEEHRLGMVRHQIDHRMAPGGANAGDVESPLAFQVLDEAGLTKPLSGITPMVANALGEQRVKELQEKFGEDTWAVAAVYEYCSLNLPISSPAYIASLYQFHWYITMDDFTAGYLWRDLETVVHGVETAALQSLEMRKKAGAAGSEKSSRAREDRRTALMGEIEALAGRNPDLVKAGAEAVARVALSECEGKDRALWKQGRGQVVEYVDEIRRGEAGAEMKARFEALFGVKPLRRLPSSGQTA